MASITPDTVKQLSVGDARLLICTFAGTADDTDTWASGLKGIIAYWTIDKDDPTTQASVGIAVENSSGTFTFHPAEDNKPFDLFILQRA